jgi:SpoVK/Ycf46/Vps4 family AAA+-type ATPase
LIDDVQEFSSEPIELWTLMARLQAVTETAFFVGHTEATRNILSFNSRMLATIPIVKLPNYTHEELKAAFRQIIKQRYWCRMKIEVEESGINLTDIFVGMVLNDSKSLTFANFTTLEAALARVFKRQARRLREERREGKEPDDFLLTRGDLIGSYTVWTPEKSPAWKQLEGMVGLEEVKKSILTLADNVAYNHLRAANGQDPIRVSINRVFVGPPGTGKTTVANLYAKIVAELGFLSKGDVFSCTPNDLLAEYIGESEKKTKAALDGAKGNALIIDDAHMLDSGKKTGTSRYDFRVGIIDAIVGEVPNIPGEDRCVILCGYLEQMELMYRNSNPGLPRRFALDTAFRFKDYDSDQLLRILNLRMSQEGIKATKKAEEVAMDILNRVKNRPNFANGAEVENVLSRAKLNRQGRVRGTPGAHDLVGFTLEPQDFDPDYDRPKRAAKNLKQIFKDYVGFRRVINQFQDYQNIVNGMRLHGLDPRPHIPFTYLFKGPPGTGKTSTARKVGQIFYNMGFLSSDEVIECSASDMVGEYIGHTGPKVIELLEKALGKVLFIDEAYRLADGKFAQEAVAELVDCITKVRFANKLIIILAGYDEDIEKLMQSNRGMRSRFATEVLFRPMKPDQCLKHLTNCVAKVGIKIQEVSEAELAPVLQQFAKLSASATWASGRSIESMAAKVIGHVFKNLKEHSTLTVSIPDLLSLMEAPVAEKKINSVAVHRNPLAEFGRAA